MPPRARRLSAEKLKTKWAQLEAVVGAEKRLKIVARDIVEHFEKRLEAMDGGDVHEPAHLCVRSRQWLRPDWHHEDDERGAMW